MSREPDPRKQILIVARPAEGGIRGHIITLLRHLDRSKYDVSLAAPAQLIQSLPGDLPSFQTLTVPITAKPSLNDFLAIARIAQMTTKGYSIVHAQGLRAGFIAAIAQLFCRFPLIVTYHNLPESNPPTRIALRVIGKQSITAMAVSQAIAARLPLVATVISNGIDLVHFSNVDKNKARTELQIAPTQAVVGCVARLSPEKGVDILLQAARVLPDILFLIAGDGPQRKQLEDSAPENVRFLGHVADVRETLGTADIVAIPSRTEGQGIVALEAMACGVPVIATAVGGLVEMIENGTTGVLIGANDPGKLAQRIRTMIDDPNERIRIGEAGKAWVSKHGDVDTQIRRTQEIYDSLEDLSRRRF